jgi:glc operon protein GlcG
MATRSLIAGAIVAAGLVALLSGPALAQLATQPTLTLEAARSIGRTAADHARSLDAGGAIAIVDSGGHLVYLERLDGTFPAAATVATDKARTAATFHRPTRDFEKAITAGRTALVAVAPMTPLQGGVPVLVNGQVVGAVGVSGAMSAEQDDQIAAHAAASLTASTTSRR